LTKNITNSGTTESDFTFYSSYNRFEEVGVTGRAEAWLEVQDLV